MRSFKACRYFPISDTDGNGGGGSARENSAASAVSSESDRAMGMPVMLSSARVGLLIGRG